METPSKNDIEVVFKRLRAIPTNKVCFDCNAKNPSWASITYGVFICIDCSAVHRGLGVHVSFVRSTQLDTNWSWIQLRQMQIGGNASASLFFRQHNCTMSDAQQKYNSKAAVLYKEKLTQTATRAMTMYGTQLHVDHVSPDEEENTEVDFFEEHTSFEENGANWSENGLGSEKVEEKQIVQDGSLKGSPNVENAFTSSAATSNESDKSPRIIGCRAVSSKRTTLGARKGGLGAQKVKTNFAEIEKNAELADQIKFSLKETQSSKSSPENEEKLATSAKLAYQDLTIQQKKEEEKLKAVSPQKAEQMERLGMGFNTKQGISHSAISDIEILDTPSPSKKKNALSAIDRPEDDDDFFQSYSSFTTFSLSDLKDFDTLYTEFLQKKKKSSKEDIFGEKAQKKETIKILTEDLTPGTSKAQSTSSKSSPSTKSSNDSVGEAQKKFKDAKSISSAQYFGDTSDSNEDRMNLRQFEGSTSISSAELFGKPTSEHVSSLQTPDFEDVKESVRQGVTKVAGKLSSLANGIMTSVQERYGGY